MYNGIYFTHADIQSSGSHSQFMQDVCCKGVLSCQADTEEIQNIWK